MLQGPLRGRRWVVGAGVHGYWLGSYEREKCALFAKIVERDSVVLDIGANVGYYSLIASILVGPAGHVYAFEPVPRNVSFLERHLTANGIENVTVVEAAVSDRSGVAAFDHSGEPSVGRLTPGGMLPVVTVTLDELLRDGTLRPPAVVKIDVEGAELAVLEGARQLLREHRPIVLLATHGDVVRDACVDLLRTAGYGLTALDGDDVSQASELLARPKRVQR